jgi:hypothetical protein
VGQHGGGCYDISRYVVIDRKETRCTVQDGAAAAASGVGAR